MLLLNEFGVIKNKRGYSEFDYIDTNDNDCNDHNDDDNGNNNEGGANTPSPVLA